MRFGSRGPSEFFFPQIRHRNALIEIARKDAVQGIYRIVREKQGIVVYRQCALQTVTSLRVVSLVFRGHDLLKITNINPQRSSSSIMPDFRYGKNSILRERAAKMEPRSSSTPKTRLA